MSYATIPFAFICAAIVLADDGHACVLRQAVTGAVRREKDVGMSGGQAGQLGHSLLGRVEAAAVVENYGRELPSAHGLKDPAAPGSYRRVAKSIAT